MSFFCLQFMVYSQPELPIYSELFFFFTLVSRKNFTFVLIKHKKKMELNFTTLKENFINILKNHYTDFNGRVRRREYWSFTLVSVIISIAFGIVDLLLGTIGIGFTGYIYSLAVLLPSLGLLARRLHDTGKSGWWMLLGLTGIGALVVLYFACIDGTVGQNEYGADPKAGER